VSVADVTKHEHPPFKMIIDAGKMIPATAYDAERLDSYRRGTKVSVRFTEEKDRVLVRKWFAILGKAVKDCKTPWKTKDQASEAIKLSLGIVNLSKTVSGAFMQYPKSLTELTDPELEEAVLQMTEIIQHITGVDPDDWRKEISDLGQDDEQNTETSDVPHASDAGSDTDLLPGEASTTGPGGSSETSSPDQSSGPEQSEESDHDFDEVEWLKSFAKRVTAAIGDDIDQLDAVVSAELVGGLSEDTESRAGAIVRLAKTACVDTENKDKYVQMIAGKAKVEVKDLV